jgi:hypothetical protein
MADSPEADSGTHRLAEVAARRGAWICAALVFAVGLAAVTFRGARTSLADNG